MIYAVWVPLLMPFVAVPTARRLADALSPVRAVRLLASTAVGLALFSTLALVLLVVPGATRLSAVAAVGELVKPLADVAPDVTVPLAAAAVALLAACAVAVARTARRHWAELHRAGVPADGSDGELTVVRDSRPDAYALPGLRAVPAGSSSPPECCAPWTPPNATPSSHTSAPTWRVAITSSSPQPNWPPSATPRCARCAHPWATRWSAAPTRRPPRRSATGGSRRARSAEPRSLRALPKEPRAVPAWRSPQQRGRYRAG